MRLRLYLAEIIVHIHIGETVSFVLVAHGEIDHEFLGYRVVDGFRCPGTTYFCKLRGEVGDVDNLVGLVYQIP